MTVINTNIKSLVSQNALSRNNRDLGVSMEQLSTGKRINSAADDAAGLAISSRMTAQIRGLDQAIRNGNDAVSLLQTAEGALIEVTNMLQRMRELSVQSANDTYSTDDRAFLDLEYQQLKLEINRITQQTQWNGSDLLNGSFKGGDGSVEGLFAFQVGAGEGQTIDHTIRDMGYTPSASATLSTTQSAVPAEVGPPEVAAVAQVDTLALEGNFVEGDQIELTLNGITASYTVLAEDLTDGDPAATREAVATKLRAAGAAAFGVNTVDGTGANVTLSGTTGSPSSASVTISQAAGEGALGNIRGLDITTTAMASDSIAGMDIAIDTVNRERADMGAVVNRLTYAVDNLANVSQNTSASRSRILDTDYAKASSELARTQIIQQAATAILAQANTEQQSVLKLLQG